MKTSHKLLLGVSLLVVVIAFYHWPTEDKSFSARPPAQAGKATEPHPEATDEPVPARGDPETELVEKAVEECEEPCREQPEIQDYQSFVSALRKLDLWSPEALSSFSAQLRTRNAAVVASYFHEFFDQIKDHDAERRRLVAVAEIYAGERLGGFWQKVLEFHRERGGRDPKDVLTAQEVYQSLRSLRVLAVTDEGSLQYLEGLVRRPSKIPSLRQQAFFAVQELDPRRSLRLLKSLESQDPLLVEITAR